MNMYLGNGIDTQITSFALKIIYWIDYPVQTEFQFNNCCTGDKIIQI